MCSLICMRLNSETKLAHLEERITALSANFSKKVEDDIATRKEP